MRPQWDSNAHKPHPRHPFRKSSHQSSSILASLYLYFNVLSTFLSKLQVFITFMNFCSKTRTLRSGKLYASNVHPKTSVNAENLNNASDKSKVEENNKITSEAAEGSGRILTLLNDQHSNITKFIQKPNTKTSAKSSQTTSSLFKLTPTRTLNSDFPDLFWKIR